MQVCHLVVVQLQVDKGAAICCLAIGKLSMQEIGCNCPSTSLGLLDSTGFRVTVESIGGFVVVKSLNANNGRCPAEGD